MPRYRFHLYNAEQVTDSVGRHFPDFEAARIAAVENARAIMAADLTGTGELHLGHWIEMEDDDGEIAVVRFRDVVTIHT